MPSSALFSPVSTFGESGADWLSDIERINKTYPALTLRRGQDLAAVNRARFIGMVAISSSLFVMLARTDELALFITSKVKVQGSLICFRDHYVMREFHSCELAWFEISLERQASRRCSSISCESLFRRRQKKKIDISLSSGNCRISYAERFIPLAKSPLTDKFYFNGNTDLAVRTK